MDIIIDLQNYNKTETVIRRTASRAIITDGNKYLLIFSKYGDYKFPGGGMEKGEILEDTVVREVQEETGYHVVKDSIKKYIKVFEKRKGVHEDLLEMESYYYFCEIEKEIGERNLDEYEEEYDYKVVWITLPEAIERNKLVIDLETCPWVIRDTNVMEQLVKEKEKNTRIRQ
ncbi:MAG: hypothetical protein K0R34_1430 [Herbinix sp.]|jgi:8-oxo-dGTP pyrophosphatase MutT (NUDIX family)|nr:hypothetical protein [Herbinix sp.]